MDYFLSSFHEFCLPHEDYIDSLMAFFQQLRRRSVPPQGKIPISLVWGSELNENIGHVEEKFALIGD